MSELRIITNHVPRDVIEAHELTAAERADFDYLNWSAIERGEDSATFARYRGELLDLGEFSAIDRDALTGSFPGWDGYQSDSFFSGLLVRWARTESGDFDSEAVILGRYYA